ILKEILKKHRFVGLIASNVTDYPWLDEIIPWFEKQKIQLSFSSLRLDKLNEDFLRFLKKNQQSFTIAPESLSSRIRKILGKNFTDEQILDVLYRARRTGFDEVKMYMIYGLDEENDQDLNQIADFVNEVRKMGYKQIKLSFNPLVPKRGTKMEVRKMQDLKILKNKMKMIKRLLSRNAKIVFENLTASYLQYRINSADEYNSCELIQRLEHLSINNNLIRGSLDYSL
ncbi:MAG: B12-binding domain-containing radical SAM protein, partial [Pseudothermotoga sp.]